MGIFGKGNSGSKYRVDEVCEAANSADHNGMVWSVCMCLCVVIWIITAKRLNRSRCRLARIVPHNHVLHEVSDPPGKEEFWGEQTWACPVGLQRGVDFMGNDAAFCQITLTSCLVQCIVQCNTMTNCCFCFSLQHLQYLEVQYLSTEYVLFDCWCSVNVCAVCHYPDCDLSGSNCSHYLCSCLQ